MTVEFVRIYKIEKKSRVHRETLIHHVMSFSGYAGSLISGFGYPGISNASQLCEISSLFLNYRSMFMPNEVGSALYNFNQTLFLIFFTIFRIILFPNLCYRCLCVTLLTLHNPDVSLIRKLCMAYCFVMSAMVTLMQFYWYRLILIGLRKMLQGMGILSGGTGPAKNDDDELEKYEGVVQDDKDGE